MLVSVIIPYYNRPEKLERALASVFAQAIKDFEIIVVDDYSTIPPLASSLKNVIYIKNKENRGPGYSRNQGLKIAKGEFICFLDSDDYWDKDFLTETTFLLNKNVDSVMAFTNGYNVDKTESVVSIRRNSIKNTHSIIPGILTSGRHWITGACLWRADIIKHIEWLSVRNWEDYAFDVAVSLINNTIVSSSKCLVYYDISGNDKLSNQESKKVIVEKAKSINYISKILFESKYVTDPIIKKQVVLIILNNIIAYKRYRIDCPKILNKILISLRMWTSFIFILKIKLLMKLSNNNSLFFLRRLRKNLKE